MPDSLATYDILKSGNLSDEHAHAVTLAIQKSESEAVVDFKASVREEFADVRMDLGGLRQEFVGLRHEFEVLRHEFGGLRLEMKAFEARIDAKLAETKAELMRWMLMLWASQIGITVALLKFVR
jgi:hypothetical protein